MLTPFQEAFVMAYMGKADGHAEKAYATAMLATEQAEELAGLSRQTLRHRALGVKNQPLVIADIRRRLEKMKKVMPAKEVLERFTRIARASVMDYITVHGPIEVVVGRHAKGEKKGEPIYHTFEQSFTFDLQRLIDEGMGHLVKKIEQDKITGAIKLEFYDAQDALQSLARIHGLEEAGPVAATVTLVKQNILALIADPETRRMADELAKRSTKRLPTETPQP